MTQAVNTAMSHRADPLASHIAADALNESGTISRQAQEVLNAIKAHSYLLPATAGELAVATGIEYHKIQRRLCDLERSGKILRLPLPVRCPESGNMAHPVALVEHQAELFGNGR